MKLVAKHSTPPTGTVVKPGRITKGIRSIEKLEWLTITILSHGVTVMNVCERGLVRSLPISRQVAEVLIASGFSHGN